MTVSNRGYGGFREKRLDVSQYKIWEYHNPDIVIYKGTDRVKAYNILTNSSGGIRMGIEAIKTLGDKQWVWNHTGLGSWIGKREPTSYTKEPPEDF